MPRRIPDNERRSRQLLLRLTGDEFDILESVAHLSRATPNTYAYGLLKNHLDRLSTDELVQADLRNRRRFEQREASTLPLRPPPGAPAVEGASDSQADSQA